MTKSIIKVFYAVTVLVMGLIACNQSASQADEVVQPTFTIPQSTPTQEISHEIIPVSIPENRSSHAGDYDSSKTADRKHPPGGDRFTFTIFERPFNANSMDIYYPYLDIVDTFVFQDDLWIFGTLTVQGTDETGALPGNYALELDMDLDGKGDWLVVASNPASTTWTVEGVNVYQDANQDVGGSIARVTDDDGTSPGDGFEVLVIESGRGSDPDLAWTRISPHDSQTLEIAVKRDLFEGDDTYMINMWAGRDLMDPALFDHSDHFTHEQAGAADPGFPIYYPIKEVYEIDNSCRMVVGFEATGLEAGICPELIPPGAPGARGCTPSNQFAAGFCVLTGGSWNANNCTCTPPTPIPPPK